MFKNEMNSDVFTPREKINLGKEEILLHCNLGDKSVVAFRYKDNIVILSNKNRFCEELCEMARSILATNFTLKLVVF